MSPSVRNYAGEREDVLGLPLTNIHLNSFMYEPILDMSDNHLRTLYTAAKALQKSDGRLS